MKIAKKNFLICFIGIDGSGKTTLAKILVDAMKENGINSSYLWCGWRQFDSFLLKPLANTTKKFQHLSFQASDSKPKSVVEYRSPFYLYLILMDYLFSTLLKVSIPSLLGQNIVCDRYVFDVIGGPLNNHPLMGKVALRLLPKPDLIFLVNLPEEIAYNRKNDIPSLDYLAIRRNIYLDMAKKFRMTIIDGSQPLEVLKEIILAETKKLFVNN